MKFDRHEVHVLNELRTLGFRVNKIFSLANAHRLSVSYEISKDKKYTQCEIILDNTMRYSGEAYASSKEERVTESVGRMIAFAYAILWFMIRMNYVSSALVESKLSENWAEEIARG